ncbi:unnamed protein product [Caretta caretta]
MPTGIRTGDPETCDGTPGTGVSTVWSGAVSLETNSDAPGTVTLGIGDVSPQVCTRQPVINAGIMGNAA